MKKIKICMLIFCIITCVSSVTLAANFYDTKGTKYEGIVNRIARLGIINGISDTAFAPNKGITRAELSKMIVFTRGLDKYASTSNEKAIFKDTKGHWAESYIATANELGIINGYNDNTFRPDNEVSYAEVIAIILRGLGYVNVDETEDTTWYSGYLKWMHQIGLDEGVSGIKSYESPAKRGDVALLWWNMLTSDRWIIDSYSEGAGAHYVYSKKPQLEILFPSYKAIEGRISSIDNGNSGDNTIGLTIDGQWYETDSEIQIYAVGGTATAIYDKDAKKLYGVSVDGNLEDYKIVAGPIFHLEENGYKLSKSSDESYLDSKAGATYAYLLVSKETNKILRTVYVDATNSYYIKDINDFLKENDDKLTSNAIVIKNGKRVEWKNIEKGTVITELIPNALYTIENKTITGKITEYDNFKKYIYIDSDKYLISKNCVYSVYGETVSDDSDELKILDFASLKKSKLEELLVRDVKFYLNVAEEISYIQFEKYDVEKPENLIDKYNNLNYKFFYISDVTYSNKQEDMYITGESLDGKILKYTTNANDDLQIGSFVMVSDIDGRRAGSVKIINASQIFEKDDISIVYDSKDELYNDSFGEYMMVDSTIIFKINKYYKDNSNNRVEKYTVDRVEDINEIENLEKYKINLLCNNDMEIDIIFAERELNKTTYPVGRVLEIIKFNLSPEMEKELGKDYIPIVKARISTFENSSAIYNVLSGDCEVGELITYEPVDENKILKIKERFKTVFLGYKNDAIIESFDRKTKIAKIANGEEDLYLKSTVFKFKDKELDLLDYKYILTTVRKDSQTNEWKFLNGTTYELENLPLEAGDRIAFGELNGIAIIYRGWKE